ncbi:MAG: hypothetical protein E7Z91_03785 [Cyanobacteria bacterium SIG30]|nr:hypothetical protein [Cyanobacteria bacterium SIG30]
MANKTTTKIRQNIKQQNKVATMPIAPVAPKRPTIGSKPLAQNSQIISGYFIEDQSYKQMVIERVNRALYCVLGCLIFVCLVSYYFVTIGGIELNQIQKETLSVNYSNEELQNQLDSIQSYYNVDKTVAKTNLLHTAEQVIELPEKAVPFVDKEIFDNAPVKPWALGY